MQWTWDEVYRESLFRAGIKGDDQDVDPSMLAKARRTALTVLDKLDGEGIALPVFSLDIEFVCTPNQEKYVLGTGADASPASPYRPETIVTAQVQIASGAQPVYMPLGPLDFRDYRNISVPKTISQPFQYSVDPKWPQADLYLYPTPSQAYRIRLACKLKWADVLGTPADAAIAQLPSGYLNSFIDVLALQLAKNERLATQDLKNSANQGKYTMAVATWQQVPDIKSRTVDAWSWDLVKAGINPL
jgi:hypothetical protein